VYECVSLSKLRSPTKRIMGRHNQHTTEWHLTAHFCVAIPQTELATLVFLVLVL